METSLSSYAQPLLKPRNCKSKGRPPNFQKTLGILLGGATQALISWWESGRYMPGRQLLG